ncbi:MAG: hypothetical protein RMJ43_14295 [Chloroherpetonaceae bacterium]|nr:hypothetical protein [Chthonomonadaceae bacterium]MDW8209001.1 hypothetical protein [Chloroherpetonaceae bacterium]
MLDHPLTRIPMLFDLGVTLLLFGLSAGWGHRILQWLHVRVENPLERGLFAITLGLGAVSHVPFFLFAVGAGRPAILVTMVLALTLLFLRDTMQVARGAWRALRDALQDAPAWSAVLLLALFPLLVVTLFGALCPPADPDGLHYHLTAPLRYLREGRFVYMPTFLHVHWPLSVEMLFAVGMAFKLHYAAALVQYGLGILLLIATYALGKRAGGSLTGWLSAGLLFPLIRPEMNWAYVDLGIGLYTLMSVYALYLGWLQREKQGEDARYPSFWPLWRLSALCAGLAATAKLLGIVTIVVLAGVACMLLLQEASAGTGSRADRIGALQWPARMLGIGFLVVSPWLIRTWILTGAPLYPYFGGLFGAKDWSPEWQKRVSGYFQIFNTFRSRHLTASQVIQLRALTCIGLIPFGIMLYRWRYTATVRPLVALFFALTIAQVATSGIYTRFLLPLAPLAFVLLVWVVRVPLEQWGVLRWVAVALVAINLWLPYQLWQIARFPAQIEGEVEKAERTLPVALGQTSRDAYLRESVLLYPLSLWCNAHLPRDAVIVLSIWDAYAALFEHRTLTTNYYLLGAIRFGSEEETLADLKRLGATHMIIQEQTLPYFQAGTMDQEAHVRSQVEMPKLHRIAMRYGKPLHSEQGYTIYALQMP